MSMSDNIADTLTRIRNGQRAELETVDVFQNGIIEQILGLLKSEGFIANFIPFKDGSKSMIKVELKYYRNTPVIRGLERVSKPGRRVYRACSEIRPALNNIGMHIFSTSKGVITGKEAKNLNVGGEYICKVW